MKTKRIDMTIVVVILVVLFALMVADTDIRLSPFSVSIHRPFALLGLLFLFASLYCLNLDGYRKGVKDAREKVELLEKEDNR